MSTADVLSILSTISGIFPVIAALYNYRQLDKVLKIAAVYCLASVLSDLVLRLMKNMGIPKNWQVIHIYIMISILLLGAMYFYAFFKKSHKKVVVIVTAIALVSVIGNVLFFEGFGDYPSISNTVLSIMLICFSLAYFYQLLTRQEFVHIEKQGLFWINAGMLFYFSINIFLFMLFKRILLENELDYYMINNVTNIVANILFTAGLLCKPQKVTSYQ